MASNVKPFTETIDWVNREISQAKNTKGISLIYLIIGAIIIFGLCIVLIVFLSKTNEIEQKSSLDIMKDGRQTIDRQYISIDDVDDDTVDIDVTADDDIHYTYEYSDEYGDEYGNEYSDDVA